MPRLIVRLCTYSQLPQIHCCSAQLLTRRVSVTRVRLHASVEGRIFSSVRLYHKSLSPEHPQLQLKSTSASSILALFLSGLAVSAFVYLSRDQAVAESALEETFEEEEFGRASDFNNRTPDYANMPIPQGFIGNLTPEQETRLKEFWTVVLKTFNVPDPVSLDANAARPVTPAAAANTEPTSAKKEKHGLFHRKNKSLVDPSSPGSPGRGSDPEDKYGQGAELQSILASTQPEVLRTAFWSMVKKDHPDALLLRFLRARKWDVQKALAMLVSTMNWRANEMHVDDDIMRNGDGGALEDAQSSDAALKREGADFLAQMRLGKSFLHGVDKEGRPICIVRVRLHKSGEQSERSLERYTVYTIETTRLAMQPPVETGTIVFDMTSFTMANMDYTPVKFMIKVFEANYPESLGSVLVHKAPWIFQGIWKIIKGWLDPVVAAKVHFTNSVEDLTAFIPRSQIVKELGGDENWEYQYIEPVPGENTAMRQGEGHRNELTQQRQNEVRVYEQKTFEWIHGSDVRQERDSAAQRLQNNYWQLDPLIRARSLYDRQGVLGKNGQLDFYPAKIAQQQAMPVHSAPPRLEASADDVD